MHSLTLDSNGTLYAAGTLFDGTVHRWLVLKSTDGGIGWSDSDVFQIAPGANTVLRCVAWTPSGLFAAGGGSDGTSPYWLTRKLVAQ